MYQSVAGGCRRTDRASDYPLNACGKTYRFFLFIENKKLTNNFSLTGNDIETSGLLYSAMFCTNQKNTSLICKSSVFIPYYQSYSSEKQRKIGLPNKILIKFELSVYFEVDIPAYPYHLDNGITEYLFQPMNNRCRNDCTILQTYEYTNHHKFIVPFLCCYITMLIGECIVPPIYIIQVLPLKICTPLLILLFEVLLL